jgi:hypothetical protein
MAGILNDIFLDSGRSPGRPFAILHGFIVIFIRARLCPPCLIVCMSAVLGVVLLIFDTHTLQAEMYVCRDQSGAMNFTNVLNGSNCKPFELQKESGSWQGMSHGLDSARYDREIRRIGTLYNVDPSLIKAIIHTESDFDNQAVSRCGAQGLMQLMPETALELRVANPFNPQENIDGGTRYFRSLLDSFNDDLVLSLAAYNAGPGLVTRTGGVPKIPETLRYINKVLKRYKAYRATW